MTRTAYLGARIFDGESWHEDSALVVEAGRVAGIVPAASAPSDATRVEVPGGMLVPGFIDLQVNGGGGVLFNNDPSLDAIRTICAAHHQFGTVALLPTLITDTVEVNERAIAAGIAAAREHVPGFLGLHLEGPHLALARKGTHDGALIRPMDDADLARILAARKTLPNLLVTVAAETVTPEQIAALSAAGIIVSIGHSDAGHAQTSAAFAAGATMATHLFNAMSQLGNREPGVVGAVLGHEAVHAGLIADGIHVHPASIEVALRAKRGPGRIFLVTDAMSQTGTDIKTLTLNGRTITRADGALRLADGTLAGADLDMIDAIRFMHAKIGLPLDEVLRMASLYPAEAMGISESLGALRESAAASFVHLSESLDVEAVWIDGKKKYLERMGNNPTPSVTPATS
ncbi:N-acetylglucosamine-6-phosphate deacetylase [Devosia geojensis]|uniref:N-acetylglucosamine-6-phosphate deacetylase n=1 Tax=Devosia geojensis TaxID=443610 RepID=A0A0F5FZT6_9HYPH|nr:N-acetylglucosamine-6-phosphate deacetylase [Devosia geojensis]KKB13707.1 N-acetylglucosamine-6-phosphate deacetylase [Devosia geojensis]